jgi:hypothetical protein
MVKYDKGEVDAAVQELKTLDGDTSEIQTQIATQVP